MYPTPASWSRSGPGEISHTEFLSRPVPDSPPAGVDRPGKS